MALDRIEHLAGRPLGTPTVIRLENYSARLGECVVCDPGGGAFTVELPRVGRADVGRVITVKSMSIGSITIRAALSGDTIDGQRTLSLSAGRGYSVLVCVGQGEWISMRQGGTPVQLYWACGQSYIQHFNGATWADQDISAALGYPNCTILGIHGIDKDTLWACGKSGYGIDTPDSGCNAVLLATTDGGATWISCDLSNIPALTANTGFVFYGLIALSATEVYIVGHEYYSYQDYYIWKWDGSNITEVVHTYYPAGHSGTIFATGGSNIYISGGGNPATDDYRYWNGSSYAIRDISSFGSGSIVDGYDSTNVAVACESSPASLAHGYDGSWSTTSAKSGFTIHNSLRKSLRVTSDGNIHLLGSYSTSGNAEVATFDGSTWSYSPLGAQYSGDISAAIAFANQSKACAIYRDSSSPYNTVAWTLSDGIWTQTSSTGGKSTITCAWGCVG